jgi:hypothetical protein
MKLSFNQICDLVLEKKKYELEGSLDERENEFIEDLPSKYVPIYKQATEILSYSSEGMTINELYKEAVPVDPEIGKRSIQINQFKKLIDKAKKEIGNIDFDVYTGQYSLSTEDEDDESTEIPNIEDFNDLDDDPLDEYGVPKKNTLEDHESIRDALRDARRSADMNDY